MGSSRQWLSHVELRCLVLGGVPDQFWVGVRRRCNPLALVADLFVCILRLFVHRNDLCGPSRSVCIQARPAGGIISRPFGRFRFRCDLVFFFGFAREGWRGGLDHRATQNPHLDPPPEYRRRRPESWGRQIWGAVLSCRFSWECSARDEDSRKRRSNGAAMHAAARQSWMGSKGMLKRAAVTVTA